MNTLQLAVQHSYTDVQVGLYSDKKNISLIHINKYQASSLLIETISKLLDQHSKRLTDIAFIGVNQGPGPFTTLRTVIATVNGLSFALGIPLVGVDGIQTLLSEYRDTSSYAIALLNAFNDDVYFALRKPGEKSVEIGYQNISFLLEQIKEQAEDTNKTCVFIGNGAELHKEKIHTVLPSSKIDHSLSHCSLHSIAAIALRKWNNKEHTLTYLEPLYIKNTIYNHLDISGCTAQRA